MRVITVTLGTVASQNAYNNFAPLVIMAFHSWSVPGKNPGTSSNTKSGILNESQNLTKRAAFVEELMSNTPAKNAGWLATIPMLLPANRAKPTTIFSAKFL